MFVPTFIFFFPLSNLIHHCSQTPLFLPNSNPLFILTPISFFFLLSNLIHHCSQTRLFFNQILIHWLSVLWKKTNGQTSIRCYPKIHLFFKHLPYLGKENGVTWKRHFYIAAISFVESLLEWFELKNKESSFFHFQICFPLEWYHHYCCA